MKEFKTLHYEIEGKPAPCSSCSGGSKAKAWLKKYTNQEIKIYRKMKTKTNNTFVLKKALIRFKGTTITKYSKDELALAYLDDAKDANDLIKRKSYFKTLPVRPKAEVKAEPKKEQPKAEPKQKQPEAKPKKEQPKAQPKK